MKKSWLFGKNIILSGASGGLGLAVSKLLIKKYNCKILGIARNEQKLILVQQELGADNFSYYAMDVSQRENWFKLKEFIINKQIKPDVLINNAGFMLNFSKFDKYSYEEIDEILETNLKSYINSVKTLLPLIKESKTPAIVNVSSAAGLCAVVGQSLYCATKFGVRGFTETLQQDYKKQIYIGGVYPGFIKTDILNRQNADTKDNKLINWLMMPVKKAAKKVVKGIAKKKKRIIFGFEGNTMNIFGRLFPKFTPSMITSALKYSKLDLFEDVFEYKKDN